MSCSDIFLGLIAILFPPIAVWIKVGLCTADSLINICLCMLGYVPGLLHAWYIIAKNPEADYDYEAIDSEDGRRQRVTYYYISHEDGSRRNNATGAGRSAGSTHNQNHAQQQGYGTAGTAPRVPANKPSAHPPSGGVQTAGSSNLAGPSVGAGSDDIGAPPSYSEVVRGDNKVQSQH